MQLMGLATNSLLTPSSRWVSLHRQCSSPASLQLERHLYCCYMICILLSAKRGLPLLQAICGMAWLAEVTSNQATKPFIVPVMPGGSDKQAGCITHCQLCLLHMAAT